jgi:hypothetical protein
MSDVFIWHTQHHTAGVNKSEKPLFLNHLWYCTCLEFMLSDQEVFSVYRLSWCPNGVLEVSMILPLPTPSLLTHYSKAWPKITAPWVQLNCSKLYLKQMVLYLALHASTTSDPHNHQMFSDPDLKSVHLKSKGVSDI